MHVIHCKHRFDLFTGQCFWHPKMAVLFTFLSCCSFCYVRFNFFSSLLSGWEECQWLTCFCVEWNAKPLARSINRTEVHYWWKKVTILIIIVIIIITVAIFMVLRAIVRVHPNGDDEWCCHNGIWLVFYFSVIAEVKQVQIWSPF